VSTIGESEHGLTRISVAAGWGNQPNPTRDIPRRTSTRLFEVEVPADQLKPRWPPAHLVQQLMQTQPGKVAARGGG
jgi:hypothetical protein